MLLFAKIVSVRTVKLSPDWRQIQSHISQLHATCHATSMTTYILVILYTCIVLYDLPLKAH